MLLLGFLICQFFLSCMLIIGLHPLDLNHEARKFEKVELIKNFVLARSILLAPLNLGKNFIDKGIVSIVKHID